MKHQFSPLGRRMAPHWMECAADKDPKGAARRIRNLLKRLRRRDRASRG